VSLPVISILIATFNRADTLKRALVSLYGLQTEGLFQFEVVVVDNASNDHTRETVLACEQESRFPIRHVFEQKAGIPFARNCGVRSATGDWIAFFDDDQLAASDWLLRLFKTAKENQVEYVGGARSLQIEVDPVPKLHPYSRQLLGELLETKQQGFGFKFLPNTGNVLIAKNIFERIGLFDELSIDGTEDSDFFCRLVASGAQGVYDPAAMVIHLIPAKRLESKYLKWIAFRHGVFAARRDTRYKGKLSTIGIAMGRYVRAATRELPVMCLSYLRGRTWDAVGMACKLSLLKGYTRCMIQDPRRSAKLSSETMHRGKG
jgi:glycosyltransferase involved in cell wall biosynthesis